MDMDKDQFATFRKIADVGLVETIREILEQEGVEVILEKERPLLDATYLGGLEIQHKVEIKIKQSNFERANELLEKIASEQLEEVDPNHYLFKFNDNELYDILLKPDEWSPFDFKLAQKILNDRGIKIDDQTIQGMKEDRLYELAKPTSVSYFWIAVTYLIAFAGGFLGIFAGWYLWQFKKTLPNGDRIFAYSDENRKHGQIVFFMALILFPLYLILSLRFEMIGV